jgi:hypothetical protein
MNSTVDGDGKNDVSDAESHDPEFVKYVGNLLTDEMILRLSRVDWGRAGILLALAALQRVRQLWHILFGHEWFSLRARGDEELYQRLRAGLLARLEGEPRYARARELASFALPETLPTSDELVAFDEDVRSYYERGFQRLEAELIRLALGEGVGLDTGKAEAFFVTHDDYLNRLEGEAAKAYDHRARALGLLPKEARVTQPVRTDGGRRGRTPTDLPYERVGRIWWAMVDEYEAQGERRPNQSDLCSRLNSLGIPIADRTLRTRIRAWRQVGLTWPPPRPSS